jgi:hypothetical protein
MLSWQINNHQLHSIRLKHGCKNFALSLQLHQVRHVTSRSQVPSPEVATAELGVALRARREHRRPLTALSFFQALLTIAPQVRFPRCHGQTHGDHVQALMTTNKRTPLEHFARQTLSEAIRADAAQLLDAFWTEMDLKQEHQSGTLH